jgi:ribose 5-phosphate isomerase B
MAHKQTPPLKVYAACDHAGLELKNHLLKLFANQFHWIDLGTHDPTSVDYPDYADRVAEALKQEPQAMGLLICGSGQGMAIRANRYRHVRAALCWNEEVAKLARAHNDANVLCMGARLLTPATAEKVLMQFYSTPFEGDRHVRRVEKLAREC